MSSKKYCKLVMVAVGGKQADQSNKYYIMEWDGITSNFDVKYGRVDVTESTASYPISQWDKKYNEKTKKGYKDVTHTVAIKETTKAPETEAELAKIEEAKVAEFVALMERYTKKLVSDTYTVKKQDVTQAQVDNAQRYLDELKKLDKKDVTGINSKLLELYMEIPRRMGNVRDYLLPNINLDNVLQQEQDNLDAMASQVAIYAAEKKETKEVKKESLTVLDVIGVSMKETKPNTDLDYLIKQLTGKRISGLFEVKKPKEDKIFEDWLSKQKDKTTKILIHGTRCTSVMPILEQGLKIRPQGNYQFSGKVYGDGNYFSETCVKSLGYTGYDSDKVLLVYEVHTGNPFIYDGWYRGNSFSLTYKNLQERGFDSTFVKAGGGLLNTEIIAYKEEQCRIRYIIWLKN